MNRQQKTNTFFNTEKPAHHHVFIDNFSALNIITKVIYNCFFN